MRTRSHRPRLATTLAAAATATALVALTGCTLDSPPSALPVTESPSVDDGEFAAGADGIGDSLYPRAGNGGYDVSSYDLDVTYDPGSGRLDGIATITAVATQNLSQFNLDFTGLDTQAVTIDDDDAEWRQRSNGEFTVTPAAGIEVGTTFTTVVTYGGVPEGFNDPQLGEEGFIRTADGAIAIGEPQVASTWFPVNDHPRDKATYTIHISAPDDLAALSNGVLVSREDAARAGYTEWTWRVNSPMAPYLATMVVGPFRVHESTHEGLPVVTAVYESLPTSVDEELARTPEIIDFLETSFGPYPFDAMGGIVVNPDYGFALENQTRPIYGFWPGGDASWLLAHELAHQWYGDSVSVDDWREIWLNEGFATYAEWLWSEHLGQQTAQQTFDNLYESYFSWPIAPGNPTAANLFSNAVYDRGAMALHALRLAVGDDDFFAILKEWAVRNRDATGTTEELIDLSEEISGQQLDDLFDDWIYGTTRPPRP